MDSDGNAQVSASKKWLALAELTCNWQLKHGNSRKFHGARGILMYLNLTFMNWYCRTGILIFIRWVNYLPSINSAQYTQRIIQTVKSRFSTCQYTGIHRARMRSRRSNASSVNATPWHPLKWCKSDGLLVRPCLKAKHPVAYGCSLIRIGSALLNSGDS